MAWNWLSLATLTPDLLSFSWSPTSNCVIRASCIKLVGFKPKVRWNRTRSCSPIVVCRIQNKCLGSIVYLMTCFPCESSYSGSNVDVWALAKLKNPLLDGSIVVLVVAVVFGERVLYPLLRTAVSMLESFVKSMEVTQSPLPRFEASSKEYELVDAVQQEQAIQSMVIREFWH